MSKKLLKVVLDCDDVLYTCNQEAINKLNNEYSTNFKKEDISSWGLMNNELDYRMKYFSDPEFIGKLSLYPGAKEFVRALSKIAEIFICTNVKPDCAGVRIASIINNFPEIDPGNILIGGRKDLLHADVLLDDAVHNLTGANVTYPVLFRQPWNRETTGLISVSSYGEFLSFINMIRMPQPEVTNPDILTFVGPSGSGKTSIMNALLQKYKHLKRVVSYTTRPLRWGEINDLDYHYISEKEFLEMMDKGEFFETSSYMGHYYGTTYKDIEKLQDSGYMPVFVLDINGAIAIKKHFKNAMNVFIKRDKDDCIRSILERNVSIDEKVRRISSLDAEMKNEEFCDSIIKNIGSLSDIINNIIF